jgi:hypothetical protein
LTGHRANDITPVKQIVIEPGVTRLKSHTIVTGADEAGTQAKAKAVCKPGEQVSKPAGKAPTDTAAATLSDRVGHLPKRMAGSRRNPFHKQVREVTVQISTGKVIQLVTNDPDAVAHEIADLYKQRWRIELFFKWIKQKTQKFAAFSASENAMRIQALIAYLVLAAEACQTAASDAEIFLKGPDQRVAAD